MTYYFIWDVYQYQLWSISRWRVCHQPCSYGPAQFSPVLGLVLLLVFPLSQAGSGVAWEAVPEGTQ